MDGPDVDDHVSARVSGSGKTVRYPAGDIHLRCSHFVSVEFAYRLTQLLLDRSEVSVPDKVNECAPRISNGELL